MLWWLKVHQALCHHPMLQRTPTNAPVMDYQTTGSEHLMKRMRTSPSYEVSFAGPSHLFTIYSQDDLLRTVVLTLNQGSNVTSLDFHQQQQTILLVGTNVGDIGIWEVGSRERIVNKTFKIHEISNCSMPLPAALVKDAGVSVS
ncbi:WD40-repeat-containing domain-containing protein [Dioscorea alata]|uniref:WD40-repeat-containing domain-containing protein n=1 Tax=Dioscorea alata TaxID=55571 RepID=A0ACB7VS30_DIOAL|nr:WD40-repeat-containing domain-containing protein [Dioscorea alata]